MATRQRRLSESPIVPVTDERRELRDAVAQLVGRYGRTYFQDVVKRGEQPDALWADLGAAGFLGAHVSEPYGGGGGFADTAVVIEECAAQGCPIQYLVISPTICSTILDHHASDAIKEEWLHGMADGSKRMCFGITEPDAGTNTHDLSTTATPHPDGGWRINGGKYWTTGATVADALIVVARDADIGPSGKPTLSLFIVEKDAPGLTIQPLDSALTTAEKSFTVFYDDVPVKPGNLIGEQGKGLQQLFAGLNPERIAAASLANGMALFALEKASQYAKDRTVWTQPIGAHQGVAHPLAKAYIDVQLARLMTMRAAELFDAGSPAAGEAANMAKLAAADACLQALDQAMQTHGGNGLSLEVGIADLYFLARMLKVAPVSREMVLNHIAQHSLGLPKSY
ncbi:acyl-CoA dehydrogenase family protein [Patulibacter minatonensis]|uniref:acyl-CoA dehydrogenase family protein n=1 Tax=Patulibacter minatonensis TaxID=298163 RepID=UPI001B7FE188|nr:acyl-CoA dehydrogenase family protein [Patulibacter minatonensis]